MVNDTQLQSFQQVEISNTTLLGAPLLQGSALDQAWDKQCKDLARAVDRLDVIGSQDGLILLRSAFSAPKVLHLLKCFPSVSHTSLEKFDALLRRSIQRISNSNLTDSQWIQASLPVRDGGLWVRRVALLAIPAFIASAASIHCRSRMTFLVTVANWTMNFSSPICQLGLQNLERYTGDFTRQASFLEPARSA